MAAIRVESMKSESSGGGGSRSTYNKAVAPSEVSGGDYKEHLGKVQFSSVAQSCLTLCDPMDCSTPGLPVHQQLLEFTQTCVR